MSGKQHESTFRSPNGVSEGEANFGEGVALMVILLNAGHTSEAKAFEVTREDYERLGLYAKKLVGGMRLDGEAFRFWIEDMKAN